MVLEPRPAAGYSNWRYWPRYDPINVFLESSSVEPKHFWWSEIVKFSIFSDLQAALVQV